MLERWQNSAVMTIQNFVPGGTKFCRVELQSVEQIPQVNSDLIGFGRPAMAGVRNGTRVAWRPLNPGPGDAPDRLVKTGFPVKLCCKFFHFRFHL